MQELAAAGRLAAWGSAALTGHVSPDAAAQEVAAAPDPGHRVIGLPSEDRAVTLAYGLGRLRALGATGLRLVLPRPGDPGGLPGPPTFTETAVACGEAVVVVGAQLGLLPAGRGLWSAHRVDPDPRTPMSLAEAERQLGEVIRDAAAVLVRLEIGGSGPVSPEVAALRLGGGRPLLPPSLPPAAHRVLAQALRITAMVELARESQGTAVSAGEMRARGDVLRHLDAAGRRAIEAACSPGTV